MLNFRKITLADRPWIQEALKQSDFMGCEYSFANNLAWCRAADSQICQYENFYLTCSFDTEDGAPHFSYPCGSGDLRKAILAMADFAAERQKPLVIFGLTSQTLPEIQALFPGVFTLENNRDDADYLYRTADFVALAGKKYHKKRNHIAQFSKYGAVFRRSRPMTLTSASPLRQKATTPKAAIRTHPAWRSSMPSTPFSRTSRRWN